MLIGTRTSEKSDFTKLDPLVGERFSEERAIDWRGSTYERAAPAGDSATMVMDFTTEGNEGDGDWWTLVGVVF